MRIFNHLERIWLELSPCGGGVGVGGGVGGGVGRDCGGGGGGDGLGGFQTPGGTKTGR